MRAFQLHMIEPTMATTMLRTPLAICLAAVLCTSLAVQQCSGNYVAAVYEHTTRTALLPNVSRTHALHIMNDNLDVYEKQMSVAAEKGVDIIVFPEYGITGFLQSTTIASFLEHVPNPYNKNLNPCDQKEYQDRPILQRLSCLAKKYQMVVVVNMAAKVPCNSGLTKEQCPNRGYYQYNTDVALSSTGQLLAKYNKENLYSGEKDLFDSPMPGDLTNYGLFRTDFGFFGLFTCFDILFGSPSIYLVRGVGVTDMIFPTAWMNELMLLSAIQFQEAWAMQFDVPLLASNQHLPLEKMTGSGIFNGQHGHVVYHYDMITYHGKLLVGEIQRPTADAIKPPSLNPNLVEEIVSKLKKLSPIELKDVSPDVIALLQYDTCAMEKIPPASKHISRKRAKFPVVPEKNTDNISTFKALMNHDLYTFRPLSYGIGSAQVSNNNISCGLNYSREASGKDHFALGAFDGWHTNNGRYYLQVCALVRCPDGDWSKCGQQTSYSGTVFEWFSLQMVGMNHNALFFPEMVTSGINLAEIGTEWNNDCPACSWIYSDKGVKRPLLVASLFARLMDAQ